MEYRQEDEYIIKGLLAGIFIVLLLILVFVAIQEPESQESNVVITNSYNTNTYSYNEGNDYVDRDYYRTSDRNYDSLRYSDTGKHRRTEGIFNDIDEYMVYVKNREDVGGYFTVRFYFENRYGDPDTEMITKYIGPYENEKFAFKDIYEGGHNYRNWKYKVTSESSTPLYYWG